MQTLNYHHLIHVDDDVKNMACNLRKIPAFDFENFLGKIKKKLRTPNRPLAQVCRRLLEERAVKSTKKVTTPPCFEILSTSANGDIKKLNLKEKQFLSLRQII